MTDGATPLIRMRRVGSRGLFSRRGRYEVEYTPAGAAGPAWRREAVDLPELFAGTGIHQIDVVEVRRAADEASGTWVTSPPWRRGSRLLEQPNVRFRVVGREGRETVYELRVDDGPMRRMSSVELVDRLVAWRYPADFAPCRTLADELHAAGDEGWVSYPYGVRVGPEGV